MFEEGWTKLSADVPVQNLSPNYEEKYQTCETFLILNYKGCYKYEIYCLRIGSSVLYFIHGFNLVNDDQFSDPYLTRQAIFSKKLQCIYRTVDQYFPCNF